MEFTHSIIIGSWIAFYLYWVSNAWAVKATAQRQSMAETLPYRLLTLAGGVLLFWRGVRPLDFPVLPRTDTTSVAGASLCLLGLALAIWSRRTLGSNWSSIVTLKKDHELVERGPYRYVRHPIYSALLVMSVGTALALCRLGPWLGVPLLFAGFWIKLRQEERLMTRHFPAEYPGYMRRVRAIIPYLL